MPINDITFIKGQGGLGRPLAGEDYVSGLIFYTGALPSGFTSSNRIALVNQVEDAEALGVKSDYSDETKATGTYLVTAAGASGDTVVFKVAEPDPVNGTKLVTIATYTRSSTDTSASLVATGIAAAINAGTPTHGYTASAATATVTITARKGLGVFLNSGSPLTVTITGTVAGTLTQFSGGVASKLAIYNYHVAEFFRVIKSISGQGSLYIGFFDVPGTPDFSEIQTMQTYANGKIRQFGVYADFEAFTTSRIPTLQTIADAIEVDHKPASILYAPDISGTTNLSSLTDRSSDDSEKVTMCIGQDGAAKGFGLFKAYTKSITCLGAELGAVAAASVAENIGWVGKFNVSDGAELDTAAFANGTLFRNVSTSLQSQLNTYRYTYLKKFDGLTGTYFNDSYTCTLSTSDYAFIENNRTIDKAVRNIRTNLLPALNSPLTLNSDGTLTDGTIAYFTTLAENVLEQMGRDQEVSDFDVSIDSTQNVLSTSKLTISVKIVPVGVARQIEVTIGFTTKI